MKNIITVFLLFLGIHHLAGQEINFTASSLAEATEMAQQEDKLIFVDAYTTWCGPCKWMAKNVFTDLNVAEFYNDKFVNFKIDMEKGEGPDLSKRWEIKGYPTLLFIDKNGDVIHRSMGSRPAEDFIDLGKAANDPDRQVVTLQKRFDSGERDPQFLKIYTDALTSAGMDRFGEVAQMYMDTQDDWSSVENMQFIFDYAEASLAAPLFQYTLEHKDAFINLVGKEKFYQKVDYAADLDRSKAGIARSDVEKLKTHFTKYFEPQKAYNKAMQTYITDLMYSKDPADREKFKSEVQLFLANTPDLSPDFYNSVAWEIYELTDDSYLLKKASEWAAISIDGSKNSYNTDTQAAILYKLGRYEDALKYAEESIHLAKANGDDYTATQMLLEKILAKK